MSNLAAALSDVSVVYETEFGPVTALYSIDVEFAQGTSTAIVGRSGSGKSTLISVLALMRRPTIGTVYVGGSELSFLSDPEIAQIRSQSVGIVFQSFHLDASLTAEQNVMLPWFFSSSGSETRREAASRGSEILSRLGIAELAKRRPNQMSGGQRQRVAIGRALFSNPLLFLADEPTGNLDEETANEVANTIFELPKLFGTAVVVVTHDTAIASLAERKLELVKGVLGADSRAQE